MAQLTHRIWMDQALAQARLASEHDDVPVGAVIVRDGQLVASGRNRRELDGDPTAHAEMVALRAAARELGSWRLDGCTMYVTLEPCAMCAGAVVLARLERLVYGATDPKAGAAGSLYEIPTDARLNHRLDVVAGIAADEGAALLRRFFGARRRSRPAGGVDTLLAGPTRTTDHGGVA